MGRGCFAFSALKPGGGGAADPPVVLLEVSVDIHRLEGERAMDVMGVEGCLIRRRSEAGVGVAEEGVEYNRKGAARANGIQSADAPMIGIGIVWYLGLRLPALGQWSAIS